MCAIYNFLLYILKYKSIEDLFRLPNECLLNSHY